MTWSGCAAYLQLWVHITCRRVICSNLFTSRFLNDATFLVAYALQHMPTALLTQTVLIILGVLAVLSI